jgi:hypothetical protein
MISFIRYHKAIASTERDLSAMKREKHIGFRIDNELKRKMTYIAEYEGRSLTWQMVHLMRECVRQFEKEHGPINTIDEHDDKENFVP